MKTLYIFFSCNEFQYGPILSCRCKITLEDSFPYSNLDVLDYLIEKNEWRSDYSGSSVFLYEENTGICSFKRGQFISEKNVKEKLQMYSTYHNLTNLGQKSDDIPLYNDNMEESLYSSIDKLFTSSSENTIDYYTIDECMGYKRIKTYKKFINQPENQLSADSLNENHMVVCNATIPYDDSYEYIVAFKATSLNFSEYYSKAKEIMDRYLIDIFVIDIQTKRWYVLKMGDKVCAY